MGALSPRRKPSHFKARFGGVDAGIDATMARPANRRRELRTSFGRGKISLFDARESSHSFPPSRTRKALNRPGNGSSWYVWGLRKGLRLERELQSSDPRRLVRAGTSSCTNNRKSSPEGLSRARQPHSHFGTPGADRRACVDPTGGRSIGPLWRLRPLAKPARTVERFPQPPRTEPTNS